MMEENEFKCSLCCYTSRSYDSFAAHVIRFHRHDGNFLVFCSVENCFYSSRSWGAFKAHMCRKHKNLRHLGLRDNDNIDIDNNMAEVDYFDADDDADGLQMPALEVKRNSNASFGLALECCHNLTHASVDMVIESVSSLIEQHVSVFKTHVREKLQEQGIPCGFLDTVQVEHLLDEVGTRKRRDKLYEQTYCYVSPKAVKLGEKFVTVKNDLVKKDIVGYCVPFQESLNNLVQMSDVWKIRPTFQ